MRDDRHSRRMRTALAVIGTLGALVIATRGTAAPTATPVANGRIAFGSQGGVVITNADGSGQWPLTQSYRGIAPGDWSPDGTALAVARFGDIYVLDPSGKTRSRLTFTRGQSHDPAFSPDGKWVAYERFDVGPYAQIWVVSVDGGPPRYVPAGYPAVDPAWSPDGKQLAWTSYVGPGGPDVWVMDFDGTEGSNRHRLTNGPGVDENPSWSPDGTRIAFDSDRSGNLDVYSMAADGSDVRRLTATDALDALPEWSPDGSQIAYVSERTGTRALFVMDPSGLDELRISDSADPTSGPAWQPLPVAYRERSAVGKSCTVWGTPADDLLVGGPGRDVVCGLGGSDTLRGGDGDDLVSGDGGADTIVAGPGRDTVVPGGGVDVVDVRDGERDSIRGAGPDTALLDRGLDDARGVVRTVDPDPHNLTRGRSVRATAALPGQPAELAVDGRPKRTYWGSGAGAPQWIEVDLGRYATIARVELVVAQWYPPAVTTHVVLGMGRRGRWQQLAWFRRRTAMGQVLRFAPHRPWKGIRRLRIVTRSSPSSVGWKELAAFAP